jgi:uncharacterized membrane protein
MFSPYLFFKFLHVAAAIVWIGGVLTLTILNARLERTQDGAAVQFLAGQGAFFGRLVVGPAAGVTLLAGVALVVLGGGNMALWTVWGIIGVFGSMAIGAGLLRRANLQLVELSTAAVTNAVELSGVRRRVALLSALNLLLLFSTVWAMVFKPTL